MFVNAIVLSKKKKKKSKLTVILTSFINKSLRWFPVSTSRRKICQVCINITAFFFFLSCVLFHLWMHFNRALADRHMLLKLKRYATLRMKRCEAFMMWCNPWKLGDGFFSHIQFNSTLTYEWPDLRFFLEIWTVTAIILLSCVATSPINSGSKLYNGQQMNSVSCGRSGRLRW